MRLKTSTFYVPLLCALTSACGLITEPSAGELSVTADAPNLVLTNDGDRPVFYFAIEQDLAALTLWAPCTDLGTCERIDRRSEVRLPYETVAGHPSSGEVVLVFWWHLVPARGGEFEPDSVRVTGITL